MAEYKFYWKGGDIDEGCGKTAKDALIKMGHSVDDFWDRLDRFEIIPEREKEPDDGIQK